MRSNVSMFADDHQVYEIKTLAILKLNYRSVPKKQRVGMSQIHLRAIMGNMDPCL